MRAARFHGKGTSLVIEEVERPVPREHEVVVQVAAAGVCGTELHFLDGLLTPASVPITLGHEVAGTVYALGIGVDSYAIGDRVVVNYLHSCGRCERCLSGQGHLCDAPEGMLGFITDGGFAEYVRVPASALVPLPSVIGFVDAAPVCCSATTALHATRKAGLTPGSTAVVYGCGGVGLALVQILRLHGIQAIAVSRSTAKLNLARELGASACVDAARDNVVTGVRAQTRGYGADAVFDLVGTKETAENAFAALGKGGALVYVGYSFETIDLSPLALVVPEHRVLSSVGNTYQDLVDVIELVERGDLLPHVHETAPLEDANRVLGDLRSGSIVGRAVLVPGLERGSKPANGATCRTERL